MNSHFDATGPGGFIQPYLPSPPPSSAHSASTAQTSLPQPRATLLKPGSTKESSFIDYVDRQLLGISRRYEKRSNLDFEDTSAHDANGNVEGRGYKSYGEMARDLDAVIDIVWTSSTPALQTPYFLTIALTACTCLPSFPFSPRPTFELFHKLDLAFCSLLQGTNVETGERLPGFNGGTGNLSTTEKVRMRGLVEKTRVAVVEVAGKDGSVIDGDGTTNTDDNLTTESDDDDMMDNIQVDGNHGRWEMEVARVYERTIVELGMALDASGRDFI